MPELRKKILYTLFIILIFRFGSCIPVPFIDTTLLSQYFEQASVNGSMLGYLDMFTGGGLSRATIFAMSITPYINASIILQLLTVAIPALERMVKDGGEEGRKKIAEITRVVTIALGCIMAIGIILIVAFVTTNVGGKKKRKAGGGVSWSAAANRKLKPMAEYEQLDENFDKAELTSKLSNLYVQMQDCWQKKDISPIRPYCTDAFFTQMDNQIQRKKQQGQTNYIERIAVLSVELRGWCQEGGNDVLVARLNTRIVDYTLDDKTGKLISGSRDKEKFMVYEWDLVRTTGTKTEKDKPMQTVNCPNCGAPVEINASAKCPYCGSVITLEEHDFALNAIRAISQQTRG